ncbi:MAG: tetratricopeptide repeat protein [bacterium]
MVNSLCIKVFILITSFLFIGFGDSLTSKNKAGNKLYEQGKYDEALAKYRDAQLDEPESQELYFNIGDILYKKQRYEEAIKEYQKVLTSKDTLLQAKTYYNIGNCQYRAGKLVDAITSYKKSLEINPNDLEVKYNLEFVRKKLKELAQKQQEKKQSAQADKQKQNEERKRGKQVQKEKDKKKMSKEDAKRILEALEEDEKDAQKRKQLQMSGAKQVEKDW